MNVFDFAMRMEEEHRAYYEKLAAAAESKRLKTIFILLADSEREHHEQLKLMKMGTDPKAAWSDLLGRAQKHMSSLVNDMAPADILRSDPDGYRHAISQEEMSINLYEKLADQEQNSSTAELLRRLANEERHHLEVMENVYDFVETPRTYLAWGEFSNLREY